MITLCPMSNNGYHRVATQRRLAYEENPFLSGTCEHCGALCRAERAVGARWYSLDDGQWDTRPSYFIEELP